MSTTNSDFESLSARISALEKLNRRMRWLVSLVILCLAVLGAAFAHLALRGSVSAHEFLVKDARGSVRATLGSDGLRLTGSDGTSNIRLVATGKDELLLMTDADGKARIYMNSSLVGRATWLSLDGEGGGITLHVDRNGKRVDLDDESNAAHASLSYVNRLGPALTLGDDEMEDQGIMTGNGIGFWDAKRKLIYSAGRK